MIYDTTTDPFFQGPDTLSPQLEGACNLDLPGQGHLPLGRGPVSVEIYRAFVADGTLPESCPKVAPVLVPADASGGGAMPGVLLVIGLCGLVLRRVRRWAFVAALLLLAPATLALAQAPEATKVQEPAEEAAPVSPASAEPQAPPPESNVTPNPDVIPVATAPAEATPPLPDEDERLNEIVVTAQKRIQKIQDVPISMSVVDGDFIAQQGITTVREALLYVPNVKMEEAGFFMIPRIRGFSTNNTNKAFEPPAGLAIDGIPYGRIEYFNAGLYDISRVEVLRGPQGTTFGKNTTAGLIHLITRDPTDAWEGFVDVQYGDYDRRRIEGAAGGHVIEDVLNVRVAAFKDTRDGFVANTTAAISSRVEPFLQGKDNNGMRLKLDFPDLLGAQIKLGYDRLELGSLGTGFEILSATETVKQVLRKYDPNVDTTPGNFIGSLDFPDFRRSKIETITGEVNYELGGWEFTTLGGRSVLDTVFSLDTDFTPVPAIEGDGGDHSPTTTGEVRLLSPTFGGLLGLDSLFGQDLGSSDLLVGVFYQRAAILEGYFHFAFPQGPFLELTLATEGSAGAAGDPQGLGSIFGFLPPANSVADGRDDITQFFDQNSKTSAVFAQTEWKFLPAWALQLGGRYSQEDKQGIWNSVFNSPPPNALIQAAGLREFATTRERSDRYFQPKVALNYKPVEEISLFVRWARAFKSGGYNSFAFQEREDQLGYKPEFSTEYAFDAKMSLFKTLKANISLYRQDIMDFQVLTREPQTTSPGNPATGEPPQVATIGLGVPKVTNAAVARAQGVEGDIQWLPLAWLRVIAAFGINDTEYLDFKINDCPSDMDNTDGDADIRCDASGKPFAFAPKYSGAFTTLLNSPWKFYGIGLNGGVTAEYQSAQFTDIDLDPRKSQPAFWRYRASIGIDNPAQGWSLRLSGENLTNEVSYIRQGDLSPKLFVGISEPPRTLYLQSRFSF